MATTCTAFCQYMKKRNGLKPGHLNTFHFWFRDNWTVYPNYIYSGGNWALWSGIFEETCTGVVWIFEPH